MSQARRVASSKQVAMVRWIARMGTVTAEAIAFREETSVGSARSRLAAASRDGLVSRRRLLAAQPSLYVITSAGLLVAGLPELGRCRVSPSTAVHASVCAGVAAALESGFRDHSLISERELRRREREVGAPVASVPLPGGVRGAPLTHRPDLVLIPQGPDRGLPIAVEVELTVKAPRRLRLICGAWARARHVAGVLYLATPTVEGPLARAIDGAHAHGRIVVAPIGALVGGDARCDGALARTIPSEL